MFVAFVPYLLGALATVTASLIWRAVFALGIGFVSYTGITVAINSVRDNLISSVKGLPAEALGLLGYLWVDKALTIVFSSVAAALAMNALSGVVKKMVVK